MKKLLVISVSSLLLLSSCNTYTGAGAYTGGAFGSIVGSAIGGLAGGHRGSDIGTLVGLAGGAMVGAAVGAAADNAEQQRYSDYRASRQHHRERMSQGSYEDTYQDNNNYRHESGFDETNSGDDRLYGFGENFSSSVSEVPTSAPTVEIRNARIIDASRDGVISRGEETRMVFEIYNTSDKPAYRILPSVMEVTGNKHIRVSENVLVESIRPGKGIRYTAVIKADNRLKDGEAIIRIGVWQGNQEVTSQTQEFRLATSRD